MEQYNVHFYVVSVNLRRCRFRSQVQHKKRSGCFCLGFLLGRTPDQVQEFCGESPNAVSTDFVASVAARMMMAFWLHVTTHIWTQISRGNES